MLDKRQFERKSYTETFYFAVSVLDIIDTKILNLVARGIDVSEGGIGIKTDYPLEPGHVLRFNKPLNHKNVGVVRWCGNGEIKGIYSVGIKFV
ncbi:MAG: PilZ domain-containing protein [Thermodesulfovibrionales bacterium]|nr:PilZ domain-containing protein [Thermodesulfovibrionales bacterium]